MVVWNQPRSTWTDALPGYEFISLDEAWRRRDKKHGHSPHDMPCRIICDTCEQMNGQVVVSFSANEAFVHRYRNSQAWFSHDFMSGMLYLIQHDAHMTEPPHRSEHKLLLVQREFSQQSHDEMGSYGDATHLVLLAHRHSHFVILYFDISGRHVTVFDGLSMNISNWEKQVVNTLKWFGLQSPDAECKAESNESTAVNRSGARTKDVVIELVFDGSPATSWTMSKDRSYKQSDGVSCGPIACLKVMELYGIVPEGEIERMGADIKAYRGAVMDYYSTMIVRYYNDLKVLMRSDERLTKIREKEKLAEIREKEKRQKEKEKEKRQKESGKNSGTTEVTRTTEVTSNSREDEARSLAMTKKNKKQAESAEKEMKRAGKAALDSGAGPGAVVTLHVDYRTHSHAQGLIAIVYDFKEKTGGILVCCDHGVITHSGTKADYWVPADKYNVVAKKDQAIPLPADLESVRNLVLRGEFKPRTCPRISYAKLHEINISATSPIKKTKGCQCKGGLCTKSCGCRKKGVTCHSGCLCLGNCSV